MGLRHFCQCNEVPLCRGAACRSRRCRNDPYGVTIKWQTPPNCHCEAPAGPWQSREGSYVFAGSALLSTPVLRDCTPRALPRAARSGRHVGLRPPRNDNSGAFTILTTACTGCEYRAGRGMPGPYNGVSEIKGARKIKGSSELINKSGWREIFWQGEVWKVQLYFVYCKLSKPMDCRKRSGIRRR